MGSASLRRAADRARARHPHLPLTAPIAEKRGCQRIDGCQIRHPFLWYLFANLNFFLGLMLVVALLYDDEGTNPALRT